MIRINRKFILLLAATFLFAISGGGNLPYYIFYSTFVVLMFAYAYITIIKHCLDVKVVFRKDYYSAGDTAECITQVNCNALLPVPYVEVKSNAFISGDTGYIGEVSNITLEENKWIESDLRFKVRGVYDLGRVTVKVMDLFQAISLKTVVDTKVSVKVYPKIYDIRMNYYGGKDIYLETIDKNGSNEDQFQIKDVRKYRVGDSLKKIHWKVSAKHNELYVKNSESISGEEIILFVDMNKGNYNYYDSGRTEERIIDIGCSIIHFIRSRDTNVKVFLNTASPVTFDITSRENFNSLMEYFVQQKSDGTSNIERLIYENSYRIHRMNRIIIVTAELGEEFISNIISLKISGFSITVYYCQQGGKNIENEQVLKKWGIDCLNVQELIKSTGGYEQ